ncbi:tetratricopeptide repeat protein [uncultured Mucilaginibacter sp.]|uniref:tetratricopeptide repeat protein n=1 Tax=uncultured Mucilaginibacter sp. TaxID=797541 RepID=UPI0025F06600|nr:tetratricopeptide repeat protein [uncultured Mucilaginibacter sp.]
MKKTILLLLAVLFVIGESRAQSRVIDSLKALLKKEKRDTARVNLLCDLAFLFQPAKPDTAIKLGFEALSLANRIHFSKGEANSLNRIGAAYNPTGNSPKAMECFLQALRINEKIDNPEGTARNLGNLALVYSDEGDQHRAIDYDFQALKIFERINQKLLSSVTLTWIGRFYLILAQYDSAMVYAQKGYAMEKRFRSGKPARPLLLMGHIYLKTGELNLALECFRSSLSSFKQGRIYTPGISDCYQGMSELYDRQQKADSALYYARKAFAISYDQGKFTADVDFKGSYLSGLYQKRGVTDSAYHYIILAKAAKDSVTSQQRLNQYQSLGFDEKLRQIELANTEQKAEEERRHNLQFAGLAVAILTFLILFFALSRTIIVKENFIKYFNVVVLLAVFEFINLLIHPYLARLTHESPPLMLLILIGIGALLVPLHHKLEHWIAHVLTEKNKQIRLAAAKKTIAHLEGGKND